MKIFLKFQLQLLFVCFFASGMLLAGSFSFPAVHPFPAKVGELSSTALSKDSELIVGWATGVEDYSPGTNVDAAWQDTSEGLGAAEGSTHDIVCLGRGGSITLTFEHPIVNGEGDDFAVFENSFSDTFLELAWVEVSSDGVHFVRFPNYSYLTQPVGGFGNLNTSDIYGFAGKYRRGYGTPFDLSELQEAYEAVLNDSTVFADDYGDALKAVFDSNNIDLNDIRYVRLVDVVGDGNQSSALRVPNYEQAGYPVFDPYPTSGSAGFDLDAVAVLNEFEVGDEVQTIFVSPIANQLVNQTAVPLTFISSSGLQVSAQIDSAPDGTQLSELPPYALQTGSDSGTVTLRLSQSGDETYAPAEDVLVSFDVVAVDSSLAPKSLSQWQTEHALPVDATLDSDGDGASDLEEYVAGTDANDATDQPQLGQTISDSSMEFVVTLSQLAEFDLKVEAIDDLSSQDGWDEMVPEIVGQNYSQVDGQPVVTLTLEVERDEAPAKFWRLSFEAN